MITCSLIPRRSRAIAIAPALGVVPPSNKLSHNSTRSAPPRSAASADSTESTQTSTITFDLSIGSLYYTTFFLGPKARFLRTLHFWVGVWGGFAAPNPQHWGGAEGPGYPLGAPSAPPNCKVDRCQAKPCLRTR